MKMSSYFQDTYKRALLLRKAINKTKEKPPAGMGQNVSPVVTPVLQIRRGNRDNLGKIIPISP